MSAPELSFLIPPPILPQCTNESQQLKKVDCKNVSQPRRLTWIIDCHTYTQPPMPGPVPQCAFQHPILAAEGPPGVPVRAPP